MNTALAFKQAPAHTNPLESIALNMLAISDEARLPQHYADDMSIDLEILNHSDKDYIWILRSHGTQLVSLKNGSNPTEVTHWTKGESKDSVKVFHVTNQGRSIKPISHDQALNLIDKAPRQLTTDKDLQGLISDVNEVLSSRAWSVWGDEIVIDNMQSTAHWAEYRNHFDNAKNLVMADFMRKAITLKNYLSA